MFANTLKTTVLLGGLGGLIILVAGLLGGGSTTALLIGLVIALVMVGGTYWFSGTLALRSAHAQIITEADSPEFYGLVRSLAERAGLPMPQVAVSPSEQPERVRHRPQPEARGCLRHGRPAAADAEGRARGRDGPRAHARQAP